MKCFYSEGLCGKSKVMVSLLRMKEFVGKQLASSCTYHILKTGFLSFPSQGASSLLQHFALFACDLHT